MSYSDQFLTMAKSCSFTGGALGAAGYIFLGGQGFSSRSLLMVLVGGAAGYAGRMINDQVLGTPGVSPGPIPDDALSCTLFGVAIGAGTAYPGGKYA